MASAVEAEWRHCGADAVGVATGSYHAGEQLACDCGYDAGAAGGDDGGGGEGEGGEAESEIGPLGVRPV